MKVQSLSYHSILARLLCGFIFLVSLSDNAHGTTRAYRPAKGICGAAASCDLDKVRDYLSADPALVNERDRSLTPLHWASQCGHKKVVELLLTRGAKVNAQADNGSTALHLAAFSGQTDVVGLLLTKGAVADARNKDGKSPLWFACNYNHQVEIVRSLLEHQADANTKSNSGVTAIQAAAFSGENEILNLLLEHGADVDMRGYRGATALHWAVDGRQKKTVALLLSKGADLDALDDSGKSSLQWCREKIAAERLWKRGALRRIEKLLTERMMTNALAERNPRRSLLICLSSWRRNSTAQTSAFASQRAGGWWCSAGDTRLCTGVPGSEPSFRAPLMVHVFCMINGLKPVRGLT